MSCAHSTMRADAAGRTSASLIDPGPTKFTRPTGGQPCVKRRQRPSRWLSLCAECQRRSTLCTPPKVDSYMRDGAMADGRSARPCRDHMGPPGGIFMTYLLCGQGGLSGPVGGWRTDQTSGLRGRLRGNRLAATRHVTGGCSSQSLEKPLSVDNVHYVKYRMCTP